MPKYYLRVEAVNLSNFVYDTDKIQPMRGGSYLLLESVHNLSGKSFNGVTIKKISTGASIGLFEFETEHTEYQEVLKKVADPARKELNNTTGNHATFVVNVLKAGAADDFVKDNETLVAMNRWQQFQQPTLMLPEYEAEEQCVYDGVRPGTKDSNTPDGKISSSVSFRKEEGGKLRSTIYKKILKDNSINYHFTGDLDELSDDPSKKNLNGKMALIYLDGNKFTKIRNETCKKPKILTEFDECVQDTRREFLKKLLEEANSSPVFKTGEKIRLEILLWGGDEIELVVPAWKGWEVLNLFYEITKDMIFKPDSPTYSLTHAAGIIFCNHKAPIRQLRNMVRILADIAKEEINENIKKLKEKILKKEIKQEIEHLNHNAHDISRHLVLESFDMVGADVRNFVDQYYGGGYESLSLAPKLMADVTGALLCMKSNCFPRNKIYEIVQVVKKNETSEELGDLPHGVIFPENLREKINYDGAEKLLIFKGIMSTGEKEALLMLSGNQQYKYAIEALFRRAKPNNESGSETCGELIRLTEENHEKVKNIYKRGLSEISESEQDKVKETVNAAINNNPQRWFLMADLWDYVGVKHD